MPSLVCPECSHPARKLEACSDGAIVNYYLCGQCGYVWTLPKHDLNATPTPVTISDDHKSAS